MFNKNIWKKTVAIILAVSICGSTVPGNVFAESNPVMSEQMTEEATTATTEEVMEEATTATTEEITEEATTATPEEVTEEATTATTEKVTEETTTEITEDSTEETKKRTAVIEADIEEASEEDFQIENGVLIAYTGNATEIVIPETVTEIGAEVFQNNTEIVSVSLPEGLLKINDFAFSGCTGMQSLNLPDSVTEIGSYAFSRCSGLTGSLKLPENITAINGYTFYNCGFSGTLEIPDSVKGIDWHAFEGCTNITEVVFGTGVAKLSRRAFYGCSQIATITFKSKSTPAIYVETLGSWTDNSLAHDLFGSSSMKSLTTIWVPEGCSGAYKAAFASSLQNQTRIREFGETGLIVEDGVLISYGGNEKNVTVPDEVTEIGIGAFQNNTDIVSVSLPEGLVKINDYAFSGCTGMQSLNLPESVRSIGNYAFQNCDSLTAELALPSQLESIGTYAFYDCDGLTGGIKIPSEVTSIGECAFYSCENLDGAISFPSGLQTIGTYAFYRDSKLTGDLTIPDSVTEIGSYAFYGCSGLTGSLKLSKIITTIHDYTFYNCGFSGKLEIPDSVTGIGYYALGGCTNITEVVLGIGVDKLSKCAFYGNSKIATITFQTEEIPTLYYTSLTSSSGNWNASTLFGSGSMSNLKVIYTLSGYLETYQNAWGEYLPDSVTISADTLKVPVSGLHTSYVYSKSVRMQWDPSGSDSVVGYYVFRDGVKIAEVQESCFEEKGLKTGVSYTYEVCGYTEAQEMTKKASLTVCTANPEVIKLYTDNSKDKIGLSNGYLYASVKNSGNLKDSAGMFYYVDANGDKKQIGTTKYSYQEASENEVVYRQLWDIANLESGAYTVTFELKDPDGGIGSLSKEFVIDFSVPDKISKVVAVGGVNQIILSWSIAHEQDTDKYYIYRRSQEEEKYTLIQKIDGRETLSYTDTDVSTDMKYYYYVVGVNDFGQMGEMSDIAVTVPESDTEAPQVVQMTPVNGSVIGGKTNVYVQAQDNIAVVKTELLLSLDDGETWTLLRSNGANYCRYSLNTGEYEQATICLKGMAYDAAGNESTGLCYTYTIDNKGPEKVTGLSYESTSTTITLKWKDVSDQDRSFFRVEQMQEDGSFRKIEDVTSTLGVNLFQLAPETEYRYRVVAYDRLGNRGTESDVITAKTVADDTAPVISAISPEAGYYDGEMNLKVEASDDTGIHQITVQTSRDTVLWDDFKVASCTGKNKKETIACSLNLQEFEEGSVYVRAVAEDIAGNLGDDSKNAPYVEYKIDRTAPETPKTFQATIKDGIITLSWNMGKEADLDDYLVYRSVNGNDFEVLKEGLYSVNYRDRSAERDVVYWYKLGVRDQAGNISDLTEAISAKMPEDSEPPIIRGFSPASGNRISEQKKTFTVLVSDNCKLDTVRVTYTVNEETTEHILLMQENIAEYYKQLEATLPVEEWKEGDSVNLSILVTDMQGLSCESDTITYTVDKTAPKLDQLTAQGDKEKISLAWQGNAEEDLAGYRIYRKTDSGSFLLIDEIPVSEGTDYSYEDSTAEQEKTYIYKVEAFDQAGNSYARESDSAWIMAEPKLEAVLSCDMVQQKDTDYVFNATESSADLGIKSYAIDFGDRTSSSKAKAVHRYAETGTYTVTLTITDQSDKTVSVQKTVDVREAELLGTARIRVVSSRSGKLSGIPVYFDMDQTGQQEENMKYTDADGYVTFTATAGKYAVGAYADGHLPVKKNIMVRAGASDSYTITLNTQPIVTGEFEVNRMTLDEISAAGIDISSEMNRHVVKVAIRLEYGDEPVNIQMVTDGERVYSGGTTVVNGPDGGRVLTSAPVGSFGDSGEAGSEQEQENMIIAIMDVPAEASFLKDFFDVKLHIINHADTSFSLEHNLVSLDVPSGMSIVKGNKTEGFQSLKGQEKQTVSWVLRGDTKGEYQISATYRGTLSPFNKMVTAAFRTNEPLCVYGADSMMLVADINKKIVDGALYFDLSIRNEGDVEMWAPQIGVLDNIIHVYQIEKEGDEIDAPEDPTQYFDIKKVERNEDSSDASARAVRVLNTVLTNRKGYKQYLGAGKEIESLSPGETFTKKYVCYNAITSDVTGEIDDIAYLRKAIANYANNTGISVVINFMDMDLYSVEDADSQWDEILKSQEKKEMYDYITDANLISGQGDTNFNYYRQAMADDEDMFKKLGEAAYGSTDCVLNLDMDLFSQGDMKQITRAYICELLEDESFQKAVDMRIDDKCVKTTQSTIKNIQAALPSSGGDDVLYDPDKDWNTFSAVLNETKNYKALADAMKTGGSDGFFEELSSIVVATMGAGATEALKQYVEKSTVAGWLGDGLKAELKPCSTILTTVSNGVSAWNESVEYTNQMLMISAAQEEALELTGMILDTPYINEAVYEEVQNIQGEIISGFKKQSDKFVSEYLKKTVAQGGNVAMNMVIGMVDNYFGTTCGAMAVLTTAKIGFGMADDLFKLDEKVDDLQRLRVAASLTVALRHRAVSGSGQEKFNALKYLIKMRLEGEKAWVDIAKKNGEEEALRQLNESNGTHYTSLDEYYLAFRETIFSYRDQLFGEAAETLNKPAAPKASIDYLNECINGSFDASYEYSWDGLTWSACDGSAFLLSPGNKGSHLWIRKAETEDSFAGNITKIYIPPRPRITGEDGKDITVRCKNGYYYIWGLKNGKYELSFSNGTVVEKNGGGTVTVKNTGTGSADRVSIKAFATESAFASESRSFDIEKANVIRVESNITAEISGGGEYFADETVTLQAKPLQNYVFKGWYENSRCLSVSTTYRFTTTMDRNIMAMYDSCKHSWDSGTVSKAATLTNTGVRNYKCLVCGAVKAEIIPKLPAPAAGKELLDPATEAVYKVTNANISGGMVEYSGALNKKKSVAVIPDTVTISGVTYKVTSVAKNAFMGCKTLKQVTIGKYITNIDSKAFFKCTALKKIVIPSNVTKIGKQAFYGCKNLKSIQIKTSKLVKKNVGSKAFQGIYKEAKIKVPKKKLSAYKKILLARGVDKKAKISK